MSFSVVVVRAANGPWILRPWTLDMLRSTRTNIKLCTTAKEHAATNPNQALH